MSIESVAKYYINLARTKRYFLTGNFEENLKQAEYAFKDKCLSLGLSESDVPSLLAYVQGK